MLRCQTLHAILTKKKSNGTAPVRNLGKEVIFGTSINVMAADAGLLGLGRKWLRTAADCA